MRPLANPPRKSTPRKPLRKPWLTLRSNMQNRPQPGRFVTAPLASAMKRLCSLSARLVEAKHEETQARAEADSLVGGTDFDEDEAEALHEAHEIAERQEHGHHEEETEEEQDEREEREDREDAEDEAHETQFAAESGHEEHPAEASEEAHVEENRAELTEAERADLAHDEAIEHVAAETMSAGAAEGSPVEAIVEDDTVLLPGETRSPRNPERAAGRFRTHRPLIRVPASSGRNAADATAAVIAAVSEDAADARMGAPIVPRGAATGTVVAIVVRSAVLIGARIVAAIEDADASSVAADMATARIAGITGGMLLRAGPN